MKLKLSKMSNKKITFRLTDKTDMEGYKAGLFTSSNVHPEESVVFLFPNNDHPENTDSAIMYAFLRKCLSARYDYGWEKVEGILEGCFSADHCSVDRATITINR